jgi:hypothetical protein
MVTHNPMWDPVGPGEIQREFHREMDRVAKVKAWDDLWASLKRKREPEEEEEEVELPDLCDPTTCTQPLHTPLRLRLGCHNHGCGELGTEDEEQGFREPGEGPWSDGESRAPTTRGFGEFSCSDPSNYCLALSPYPWKC